jgi:hypothetical protein
MAAVLKTARAFARPRGFESHTLRILASPGPKRPGEGWRPSNSSGRAPSIAAVRRGWLALHQQSGARVSVRSTRRAERARMHAMLIRRRCRPRRGFLGRRPGSRLVGGRNGRRRHGRRGGERGRLGRDGLSAGRRRLRGWGSSRPTDDSGGGPGGRRRRFRLAAADHRRNCRSAAAQHEKCGDNSENQRQSGSLCRCRDRIRRRVIRHAGQRGLVGVPRHRPNGSMGRHMSKCVSPN